MKKIRKYPFLHHLGRLLDKKIKKNMRCNFILIKNRDSSIGSRKRCRSRNKESQNKKEFNEVHKIRQESNEKFPNPKEEKIPLPEKKTKSGNYFLILKNPVKVKNLLKFHKNNPNGMNINLTY
jgi:hypothetical protein